MAKTNDKFPTKLEIFCDIVSLVRIEIQNCYVSDYKNSLFSQFVCMYKYCFCSCGTNLLSNLIYVVDQLWPDTFFYCHSTTRDFQ